MTAMPPSLMKTPLAHRAALPEPSGNRTETPGWPPIIFPELSQGMLALQELRRVVEGWMQQLPEEFNREFPRTPLRLRAWSRRKGEPPFALYWIRIPPRKLHENFLDQVIARVGRVNKPFFIRLKIRTSRELDRAIHRGCLDSHRRKVHAYHRRAEALNQAHKVLTGALDTIRKVLNSRAGGKVHGFASTTAPPKIHLESYSRDIHRLLDLAWRFEKVLWVHQRKCRNLCDDVKCTPGRHRYRLQFAQDRQHPYGRFLWLDAMTGLSYSSMTDRAKRKLRMFPSVRELITPFEIERRRLAGLLKRSTALIRRIRSRIPTAIRRASEWITQAGYPTVRGSDAGLDSGGTGSSGSLRGDPGGWNTQPIAYPLAGALKSLTSWTGPVLSV